MNLPFDINEISTKNLETELQRRSFIRANTECYYCGKPYAVHAYHPCKLWQQVLNEEILQKLDRLKFSKEG